MQGNEMRTCNVCFMVEEILSLTYLYNKAPKGQELHRNVTAQ